MNVDRQDRDGFSWSKYQSQVQIKPNDEQSHCQHDISHITLFSCFPRCLEYHLHAALMGKVLRNETTKCAQLSCELTFSV